MYLANKVSLNDQRWVLGWGYRDTGLSWNLIGHWSDPILSFVTSLHFIGWTWKDLQFSQFTDFPAKFISKTCSTLILAAVQTQLDSHQANVTIQQYRLHQPHILQVTIQDVHIITYRQLHYTLSRPCSECARVCIIVVLCALWVRELSDFFIYGIKLLLIADILTRPPYSNMSAMICSDYFWETRLLLQILLCCWPFTHHIRNSDEPECQFNYANQYSWHLPSANFTFQATICLGC